VPAACTHHLAPNVTEILLPQAGDRLGEGSYCRFPKLKKAKIRGYINPSLEDQALRPDLVIGIAEDWDSWIS
jgi:hypothetical protein